MPVVHDLCDHHLASPHTPPWASACFAALCRLAARIIISGQALDELAAAARAPIPSTPPILLCLGTLYEWFDFNLIRRVAPAHPAKRIVLVGPVARAVRKEANALLALPNVTTTGRVSQPGADEWLAQASICLVPFVWNPLTRSINPNKLYEYLAQ